MARLARTEPSLTEWAALGVLCEGPAHGWDVARHFRPDEDFGQVWSVSRALVYRAIGVLRDLGYIVEKGSERSAKGPHRLLLAATPRGRQALRRWLSRPAQHVRDLRSELLLKLLLLDRAGKDSGPLLQSQLAVLQDGELALADRVARSTGFERTVSVWRLTTARAARAFVEALLDDRSGEPVSYEAIGYVSSAHTSLDGMPLQPEADVSGPSRIVLTEPHRGGLQDVDGFSHIWVLAHLHESIGWAATVDPFLDDQRRGTFATRSPHRPNPISLSLCRLLAVEADSLVVQGLDLLDRTPVLDIKPYVPFFDSPKTPVSAGWFEGRAERIFERTSDDRFERRSRR
ncbi:MAG TPA: tRNA (N6-threonylcarbamoyladenosine(37)-N6)-methyltransferase TrmO [Gaiellaceae bacterium]|jgi:tRNA-Thr(GGU) m(6)t(6)A37 methyltransferase TsaA